MSSDLEAVIEFFEFTDWPSGTSSLDLTLGRLVDLATEQYVSHVLGCHIELSRKPGHDYPVGARQHPAERPLPMTVCQLRAVHASAAAHLDQPGVHPGENFILYNGMRFRDQLKLRLRKFRSRLRK